MRRHRKLLVAAALVLLPAIAGSTFSIPAVAAEPADDGLRHGVGLAYSGSTIEFDVDRGGQSSRRFDGWGVFGKFGISERWAVLASYRDLGDNGDLDPGEEIALRVVDAHAGFIWLVTPNSRWHAKAGVAWLDFESRRSLTGATTDSALSPSIGVGFEWGLRRVRLYFDFGVAFSGVELIPGESENLVVGNSNSGLMFKF